MSRPAGPTVPSGTRSGSRIAIAAVLAIAASAPAEDWPRFRGPTGQGISSEKDVPLKWSAQEHVAWKVPIPGDGWSSPIVAGGRVYVTTAADGGASCRVICLEADSGKVLWDKEVLRQALRRKEGRNSFATPTPAADGERVYTLFAEGTFVALTPGGETAWTNRDVKYYSQHGLGGSPILYGDLLIMAFDGSSEGDDKSVGWRKPWDQSFILALDRRTGKERWRGKRGLSRIAHVTPAILRLGEKDILVSAAGDAIQGHDPGTGERIWTVFSQGEGVVPSVVAGGGMVFATSGFEDPTVRAVRADGKGDVTKTHIAWELKKNVPMLSSMLLVDRHLYGTSDQGVAWCVEAATGKVAWQSRIGGSHSSSPVTAAGRIYFLSEEGESVVLEAGPAYKELARNPIGEKCQASMAFAGGRIFIRSERNLFCITR